MNAVVANKGKIHRYECGGAAINIAAMASAIHWHPEIMADISTVLIDTSPANLSTPGAEQYSTHLIEGLDGSGKKRILNKDIIKADIPNILHAYKPGELNIVTHSVSGGSGSVIGPMLVRMLLERGETVIVLAIGSTGDLNETVNSINALKTYDAMAAQVGRPVNVLYLQNSPTFAEAAVDQAMLNAAQYLSILFSRMNGRLDSQDLKNWLNYHEVTSYEPHLTSLSIMVREADDQSINKSLDELGDVISLATLIPQGGNSMLVNPPEYHTVGVLPDAADSGVGPNVLQNKTVRFVLFDGQFQKVIKDLEAERKKFEEKSSTRPRNTRIAANTTGADEDGEFY